MKNVLDWIKTNPFIVACGAVALVALIGCGYLLFVAAPGFTETRSDELNQIAKQQRSLMNISVPLPNEDPNAPPVMESVVVNESVIREVSKVYSAIGQQYETIVSETTDVNAARHRNVLLGGDQIWPNRSSFELFEEATAQYKDHFKAVFAFGQSNPWNLTPIKASSPPTEAQVKLVLENAAFDLLSSIGATSGSGLTEAQAKQLYAEQRVRLMDFFVQRARNINLYAQLPREQDIFASQLEEDLEKRNTNDGLLGGGSDAPGQADNGLPAGYPFNIADWAFATTAPKPDQLWEGQVQLWILRDITHAIAVTNNVGQTVQVTKPDGSIVSARANVLNSPIKRLLRLETLPGYVGMHTIGGVFAEFNEAVGFSAGGGFQDTGLSPAGPTTGAAGPGTLIPSIYPQPPSQLAPTLATEQVPEHFGISPTGRISNSVFDVRHTRLIIDIEWKDLVPFMQQLREVNFMTVIKAEIEDLDEYQLLQQGYVYGSGDVVRAELLVESLWFRDWTAELMPRVVRQKLLIDQPAESQFGPTNPSPGAPTF